MPELPEVETIVRQIRSAVVGRRIERASLRHHDVLREVTGRALERGLAGARVTGLERRAKHAVFRLDRGTRFVIQPGMTGGIHVVGTGERDRYAVLRLGLDDGRTLLYRDIRRFGTLLLLDAGAWRRYDAALGPEPLAPDFSARDLARALGRSRQAIKKALMDQKLLAGVGNIYANEALFEAGIDPSKPAADLAPAAWGGLNRAVRRILRAAIRSQGSTIRDYRTGTGESGGFQLRFKVYEREGEPCLHCGTTLTGTHAIDARITVFCHRCQR